MLNVNSKYLPDDNMQMLWLANPQAFVDSRRNQKLSHWLHIYFLTLTAYLVSTDFKQNNIVYFQLSRSSLEL